ncbi:MAG TPA: hypothetical protein VIQ78_05165 [Terrimesophilobacter sp.]|jgi:Coenzyme F420-dependent N5,N10-methylene tetrahydromethanopterin reductase and related flavin-dependent oxidoreductases|uniref:hypothetical protein n=1 Tax=Terrimesophilobacter sp. TaxID=2906435 RepID=UPI002F924E39
MKVAISTIPTSIAAVREIADAVERSGVERLGIADSPHLLGAAYPAVQDALARTRITMVGPFVTNPVTVHSSVHAANLRALAEMHPGRVAVAIGVGDSAVTSVGLAVARRSELAAAITAMRTRLGDDVEIEMAVSGPLTASSVPPDVDGVILGSGLSVPYARKLREIAENSAGKKLSSRVVLVSHLINDSGDFDSARRSVLASAFAYARHGIGRDGARRDVPEALQPSLDAVIEQYRMGEHARVSGGNAQLLERHPDVADYLVDRFAIVGAPAQIAQRLADFCRDAGIDGVSLSVNVPDPLGQVEHIGRELVPELNNILHALEHETARRSP